jgi:hypothetical protein
MLGGDGMAVRMVCIKAPRFLSGVLKVLIRRGKR